MIRRVLQLNNSIRCDEVILCKMEDWKSLAKMPDKYEVDTENLPVMRIAFPWNAEYCAIYGL